MCFSKTKLRRYADVMVWGLTTAREKKLKKGDIIRIYGGIPGIPLIEEIHAKLTEMGFNVSVVFEDTPRIDVDSYNLASDDQIKWMAPWAKHIYKNIHGNIYVDAPTSITHLKDVDPKKISMASKASRPIWDILDKREEQGDYGWTLCAYPTQARADQAGLTLRQYANQIEKACWLNKKDPVAHWNTFYKAAQKLKRQLNRLDVDYYQVSSKNINLMVWPGEQRQWVGLSGHNIPSFEFFLSPDCRYTEGTYYADQPSFRAGNRVSGTRLVFKKGKVAVSSAEEGENFLKEQLKTDKGACMLGEFSLTDRRFSKINKFMASTLFDENFGGRYGNMHVALGASYSDTYSGDASKLTKTTKKKLGFNESAIHWDLVNTEKKRVTAHLKSGKQRVIYENGEFTYKL